MHGTIRHCFILVLLILTGCGGGESSTSGTTDERGNFISSLDTSSQSLSQLETLNEQIPHNFTFNPVYGVDTKKIVYKTIDTQGNFVDASGLLIIPKRNPGDASPVMIFHHGTVIHNDDAPTGNSNDAKVIRFFGYNLASQGYIVLMPDYIGYGESAALLHPYLHADSLASSSVDMLRASKDYLAVQGINSTGQLFLAGYSEGGYAALATHKIIESNHADEFIVTASVPGAGPYHLSETLNNYLLSETLPNKIYIAFAFKAYDTVYGFNRISEIFQMPYDEVVNTSFYGDVLGINVDAFLTNTTADLFTPTFLSAYLSGEGELSLKEKIAENNLYNWVPVAPVHFYHGIYDAIVPIFNAYMVRDNMLANSVNANVAVNESCVVKLNAHGECFEPYLDYAIEYMNSLL